MEPHETEDLVHPVRRVNHRDAARLQVAEEFEQVLALPPWTTNWSAHQTQ
jgi:hypothetical protein